MPHTIERAVTGRAKCRGCNERIAAGQQRFGERVPNPYGDEGSETTHWYHVACAAFTRPEAFLEALPSLRDPIDNRENEMLRDQVKQLQGRINVLERIVTDRGVQTAAQIEALRDRDAIENGDKVQ